MATLQIFVPFLSAAGGPLAGRSFLVLVLLFIPLLSPGVDDTINWTKYDNTIPAISDTTSTNGKIPLGNNLRGDDFRTLAPSVIKDGATYKMWYGGHDGVNYRIYYATSSNGLNWAKYDNGVPDNSDGSSTNGKIPLGNDTKGDDAGVMSPFVLKDGSTYKMWYGASDGANWRIYYATSTNGLDWVKLNNTNPAISDTDSTDGRIPLGNSGRGDSSGVFYPSVIQDGSNSYKMWYAGYDGVNTRIYYATSTNGLDWVKLNNTNPTNSDTDSTDGRIPRGTPGKGDSASAGQPKVIKVGNTYKMWYYGDDGTIQFRIYHATSPDGLTWTKFDNTIPPDSDTTNSNSRLGLGTANKGDDTYIETPAVILVGERDYKMWYSGYDGINYRIYHATFQIPPPAGTVFTFR